MKKATRILILSSIFVVPMTHAEPGTMPIPVIDTAEIETTIEIVKASGGNPTQYVYRYSITNPLSSVDSVYKFGVDISAPRTDNLAPTFNTIPTGLGQLTRPFSDEVDFFFPFFHEIGNGVVSVGLECPTAWNGGLRKDGTIVCHATNNSPQIDPGEAMEGFTIYSRRPPTLRNVFTTAFWTLVVDNLNDATEADKEAAFDVQENLLRVQRSLAPSNSFPSQRGFYAQFINDLAEVISMGWIPKSVLADEVTTIVQDAGLLFDTAQGSSAKLLLDDVIAALDIAGPGDIISNAEVFLRTNVDAIQEFAGNSILSGNDLQFRPRPLAAELEVGETINLDVFVFRFNPDFRNPGVEIPQVGSTVWFGCDESAPVDPGVDPCPNFPDPDNLIPVPTDVNGIATLSYEGVVAGRDHIEICGDSFCEIVEANITIDWFSLADLAVPFFSPALNNAQSGDVVTFSDWTANIGETPTGPSVTRYFISDDSVVDPQIAAIVGERVVPGLQPGEISMGSDIDFVLPPGFASGTHNLIACADADFNVAESNEQNNCSDSQVSGFVSVVSAFELAEGVPIVSVADASVTEGNSGQQVLSFAVSLTESDSQNDVTIQFSTQDGTATAGIDYETANIQVVFAAGTTELTQTIPVIVNGDFEVELDETVLAEISDVGGNALIGSGSSVGTIENDDLVAVAVSDVSALEGDSGITPFSFDISIDQSHPTQEVTVFLQTVDGTALAGSDYTAASQLLVFPAGTATFAQTVIVNGIGDEDVEPDEGFTLNINSVSANAAILDGLGIGTILNDDSPPELDCSNATASPNALWPPNHKLVTINVGGVFGLDGSPAGILVTGIEQDEPVNGLGDGDTSPDGFGVGTDSPQVRRERSGTGDGRIYFISFDASDTSTSASCSGQVTVAVPHDRGRGSTPIDSGVRFDSTVQ